MFNNRNLLFFFILTFFACANIGPAPRGGPEDKTPPVLLEEESTQNFQTNFKKQDISLVFNEYVDLKDIFKQVIISPPLQKRWKLSKKLKTVIFEFNEEEVLREDATYTINFGECVRDYTAGNPVPDFRFVFSTGSFIDSMEVSGNITDALTGKPAEDVFLLLYDNLADSVVRTETPFYFAKTDKEGNYKVQNVKSDTFKVFALKDEGLKYLFNQESELIGFPDSLIVLSKTKETIPPISIFLERPALRLTNPKNDRFGMVNLKFNQNPFDVKITHEDIGQKIFYETDQDSVKVWYDQTDTSTWNIFIEQGEDFKDTFLVKPQNRVDFLAKDSLRRDNARKAKSIKLNPSKAVRLLFNHPLIQSDSIKILLLEDSMQTPVVPNLKIEGKELVIDYKWKEAMSYQVQILPGALTDLFQLQNKDTIRQNYQAMERKAFGDLNLSITDLDIDSDYVINLYLEGKSNLVESIIVNGKTSFEKYYKTMPPGKYLIEIVTDLNGNGRWDTGNYDKKSQPEPFFSKKLENLRENWELDAKVSLKE